MQQVLTHPVLGEDRRSDTWYMPLVLPERLEFLCRDTNMQSGGTKKSFISQISQKKLPLSVEVGEILYLCKYTPEQWLTALALLNKCPLKRR